MRGKRCLGIMEPLNECTNSLLGVKGVPESLGVLEHPWGVLGSPGPLFPLQRISDCDPLFRSPSQAHCTFSLNKKPHGPFRL